MMTIDTSRYCNARRPCRFSTGHGAACPDRQFGPLWKGLLPINASPLNRDNLLSHRIGIDHCPPLAGNNSNTASAALKSP
jgi:hypothetical protein